MRAHQHKRQRGTTRGQEPHPGATREAVVGRAAQGKQEGQAKEDADVNFDEDKSGSEHGQSLQTSDPPCSSLGAPDSVGCDYSDGQQHDNQFLRMPRFIRQRRQMDHRLHESKNSPNCGAHQHRAGEA